MWGTPRVHGIPKPYQSEKCPKIFTYLSPLEVHQRRHKNERTFIYVCVCDKGLFQTSDLRGYQQVRAGEKRLRCSAWVMSFSHRANRLAQERTRTGEREALWVPCATDTASTAPPPAATRGCARELLSDTLLPHQKLPRLQPRM